MNVSDILVSFWWLWSLGWACCHLARSGVPVEFTQLVLRVGSNLPPSTPQLIPVRLKFPHEWLHADANHVAVAVALHKRR